MGVAAPEGSLLNARPPAAVVGALVAGTPIALVVLPPRVLGEIVGELGQELALRREALPVLRREVEDVLVRDVHARDGDRLVVVHLLHELARELDRLDVRAERAPERAFDEGLQAMLDAAEDAHRRILPEAGTS